MPNRPLLHEWMHRFELEDSVVRIWTSPAKRDEGSKMSIRTQYAIQQAVLKQVIDKQPKARPDDTGPEALVEQLAALPCVAAVEHVDKDSGNGRLIYVDWP